MQKINQVSTLQQHGKAIYSFKISAAEFLKRGSVKRLADNDDEDAVQRELTASHVIKMAESMLDPEVLWPDSLVVAFSCEPAVSGEGELSLPDDYEILIVDGQHRYFALKAIQNMEGACLPDIDFTVNATYGLTVTQIIDLFKSQIRRKAVTKDFALALDNRSGKFATEAQGRAYGVIMRLAHDPDSPLYGLISDKGNSTKNTKGCYLGPAAIVQYFKIMFGPRQPWEDLTEDQIVASIKAYIGELLSMWDVFWKDTDSYTLQSNASIIALLACFSSNKRTRVHLGGYADPAKAVEFAKLFSGFRWNRNQRVQQHTRQLIESLEAYLINAIERKKGRRK